MLVTGAAGFLGSHLVRHVLEHGDDAVRILALDLATGTERERVTWATCDLTDAEAVRATVRQFEPTQIVHLAGVTRADDLGTVFRLNVATTEHVLGAAAACPTPPAVLVVGSAAQYGITSGGDEVVDEDRDLNATTPYGISKNMQERWALMYAAERSLPVVCVRPFNIIGPGQPPHLVPATFLTQVAAFHRGEIDHIDVGDMSTRRDFTDVRDVVAAMWGLVAHGPEHSGRTFVIASGRAVRIQDLLDEAVSLGGRPIPLVVDEARLRRHDVPSIIGDAGRLRAATGWEPTIDWRHSLRDAWDVLPGRPTDTARGEAR